MEVVCRGVIVDLGHPAFLGTDGAGEVTEVVGGQRDVRVQGLPDGLAVVPGLGNGEQLQVLHHPVRDLVQDHGSIRWRGLAPGRGGLVGCVQGKLNVLFGAAGCLGELLAGDGGEVREVLALGRGNPFPADPVLVASFELDLGADLTGLCINRDLVSEGGNVVAFDAIHTMDMRDPQVILAATNFLYAGAATNAATTHAGAGDV